MPQEQMSHYKYPKPCFDIYSVGATLYFMITGKLTHDFSNRKIIMMAVSREGAKPIRERDPKVPTKLAGIIDKAVEFDPEDRFSTAGEMKKALDRVISKL